MKFDPDKHHRRSIRLRDYDYTTPGAYFITVCTYQRECLFGDIVDGVMKLNQLGTVVQQVWKDLPNHYFNVDLDYFVIMPNHVHGIVILKSIDQNVGAGLQPALALVHEDIRVGAPMMDDADDRAGYKPAPTKWKIHGLPEVVRGFKTFSAKRINQLRNRKGVPVWQRNYFEHVIRNENEMDEIRMYIEMNPSKWEFDRDNPLMKP